jgi:hypothetical protein
MENRKVPALIALAGIVIAVVVFLFVADDDTADQESETTQQAEAQTGPEETDDGNNQPEREPEEPEEPAEPQVPQLEIRDGAPVGGPLEVEVTVGEELRIDITTDAPDELHLHTYDVYLDVVPGKTNELVVENADIEGVIELESHSTGTLLAEISVVPG